MPLEQFGVTPLYCHCGLQGDLGPDESEGARAQAALSQRKSLRPSLSRSPTVHRAASVVEKPGAAMVRPHSFYLLSCYVNSFTIILVSVCGRHITLSVCYFVVSPIAPSSFGLWYHYLSFFIIIAVIVVVFGFYSSINLSLYDFPLSDPLSLSLLGVVVLLRQDKSASLSCASHANHPLCFVLVLPV